METLRREVGALGWLMRTLIAAAVAAAIYKELQLPPDQRTWQGRLFGFVPYDFRLPTPRRMLRAWWDPDSDRLFNDQPFGVGWAVNLAALLRIMRRVSGTAPSPTTRRTRKRST
jgi:hypothetical protein